MRCCRSPTRGPARLADNPNRVGLLRLSFDDVDPGLGYRGSAYSAFDESLARAAADFVAAQVTTSELLVVQCEFGRSRSAGLGAAFSRWANGDDAEFFVRFEPNRHVYAVMLRQLESYPLDGVP
jgi:protein-tyrosine phosphatase